MLTRQRVHNLHDGACLRDARKIVHHERHEERALPSQHHRYPSEDGGPRDGRNGIVEEEVGLFGPEAVRFGHVFLGLSRVLCRQSGAMWDLNGDGMLRMVNW